MDDLLDPVLQRFELRSRVFHAGKLCSLVDFDASDGVGHLHLLKAGRLRLIAQDGQTRVLDEPSLIFYPRASAHRLQADDAEGAELVCASVAFGAAPGHPLLQALPPLVVLPLQHTPGMAAVLQALFSEAFGARSGRETALNRLTEVLLIHLLRQVVAHGGLRAGVLAGLADARLARALAAMHAEPARAWTLQALAMQAGMSRARFAAHFGVVVGQPAIGYLADWRLGLAQGLLARGRQVKSIADEVGYGSPNALSRAFTQRLGLTPTAWLAAQAAQRARPAP